MASVGSDQRAVFILCGLIPERVPDRYPVMKGNLFGVVEGYRAPGASWGSLRGGRCDNHAVSCKHGPHVDHHAIAIAAASAAAGDALVTMAR